jgi:chorismate synthase
VNPGAPRIGEILELADVRGCEEIQREVWGLTEAELVPLGQLRAAWHAGGLLAGAWLDGKLVGFSYAFPAYRPEEPSPHGLHSHMTAVVGQARGRGIGRSLKWFQRRWCLERGIDWVEWTFDPLRAANARLNIEHLGAKVGEYLVDAYGSMNDSLNAGMPSDRMVARWGLTDTVVASLEAGGRRVEVNQPAGVALEAYPDGSPGEPKLDLDGQALSIAVPNDIGALLAEAPEVALAWRQAVRAPVAHYLRTGYRVERFLGGGYRLERQEALERR